MKTVILSLFVVLMIAITGNAQDACKVKVILAAINWDGTGEPRYGAITPEQLNWWLKDGQKKFASVCLVDDKDKADYVIKWNAMEESGTYTYPVANTSTANTSGTVYAGGSSGTYNGTTTTTTYSNQQGQWHRMYVNAGVYKPDTKMPVFFSKHVGRLRWSKPDKDAFEDALKFIQKQQY